MPIPDLDVAHAAFEEPAGDQELAGVDPGAVHLSDVLGLARDVEGVAGFRLHAIGQLERLDAGLELGFLVATLDVVAVQFKQQVELIEL